MDLTLISQNPLRLSVTFHPCDPCFADHFPKKPVVPGSLILALCLHCLNEHVVTGSIPTVHRFSFPRFAPPGAYELSMSKADDAYLCRLYQGETIYAQGRIQL